MTPRLDAEPAASPELTEVLSAPEGSLSLRGVSSGCFHHESAEIHLSWSPSSAVLRTPEGERRLDPEQLKALLTRVISTARLPVPQPRIVSTTHVSCQLDWSYETIDNARRSGCLEWKSSEMMLLPDSPPVPALELFSIASEPLPTE